MASGGDRSERRVPRRRSRWWCVLGWALLVLPAGVVGCTPTGGDVIDLEGRVQRFVDDVPGRGSEAMDLPTEEQAERFIDGLRAARAGHPGRAGELVGPIGYRIQTVVDSETGRTAHVFEEQPSAEGGAPHGWGMYVVASHPERRLVVEVAHPVFDIATAQVGLAAFREAGAAALLVAGTHRYANRDGSSDVAHDDRTMFARVHRALVTRGDVVLQPHGFDEDGEAVDGAVQGTDVVVSGGAAPPSTVVQAVASTLRSRSFEVCVFDGSRCAALGATGNVEGAWCREVGAGFVHLELSRAVRDDRRAWMVAVAATVEGLARTARPIAVLDAE